MTPRTWPPWWPRARGASFAFLFALAFWLLVFALLGADVRVADAILIGLLLVGMPALAILQLPHVADAAFERVPAYWSSMAVLWVIGTASWLVGTAPGGPAELGLVPLPASELVLWTAGLLATALLLMLVFRALAGLSGARETRMLRELLPRTAREKRVFALLSISAGVAEELAYRGYLLGELSPFVGWGGAALVSSLAFGVAHAYQGALGTLRTTILGGLLAGGFLASGSLWPAIVAHALIDVIAGISLGERLLPPERARGVREGPDPSAPEP